MFHSKSKTFKPRKGTASRTLEMRRGANATLNAGNLKLAVELPPGENICEWLSANTIDFFNQVNLLYGAVSDFCTTTSCPSMTAGASYEYLWQGGPEYPKPTSVPAAKYVDLLMAWIQNVLDDTRIFPEAFPDGATPSKELMSTLRTIYKRLFRVYAHMYHSHLDKLSQLGIEAHLNTGFKHFYLFAREFKLIEDRKEFGPLMQIIEEINKSYGLKP